MRYGRFNPATSILAGRPTTQLQADLAAAQSAYIAISTGAKGVSYSYTQNDGAKSVTYDRTNIGDLTQLIRLLQAQLGIIDRPRSSVRFRL